MPGRVPYAFPNHQKKPGYRGTDASSSPWSARTGRKMCIRARLPCALRGGRQDRPFLRPTRQKNEPFSFIRTVTVGSGISPVSADPHHVAWYGARGLMRKTAITAGGDLHPALRMEPPYARLPRLAIPGHKNRKAPRLPGTDQNVWSKRMGLPFLIFGKSFPQHVDN